MKMWLTYLTVCVLVIYATAFIIPREEDGDTTERIAAYIKEVSADFTASATALNDAVQKIDTTLPITIDNAKAALRTCRLQYKRFSFLLDYFFTSEAVVFNNPPKYEVDEPDMEYQHPVGLQTIEELLYEQDITNNKSALQQQAQLLLHSAQSVPAMLYQFKATNKQVLESAKLELIRVMVLYITGYDAPLLKSGVEEAAVSINSISNILAPYMEKYAGKDSLQFYLQSSLKCLQSATSFDAFNRLQFLTDYALPLQRQLNKMVQALHLQLSTVPALDASADNLFSPNTLNKNVFDHSDNSYDTGIIHLGKQLFFEKTLSGNGSRSCSSCHSPLKYFTDGLQRNTRLNSNTRLPRNTPTLLYSAYQYSQFWDGRAKNIQQQADIVLHNKLEMDANNDSVLNRLQHNAIYAILFKKIWHSEANAITMQHTYAALAAYVKTLTPFQSPFDRYMSGDTIALNHDQQEGFDIFMGKAACGTCHFAPLFNGLTPPLYNKTEYEIAGTPLTADLLNPKPDNDSGRYAFFPISFYIKAFKTPTVRNAAVTAPYMHNGALNTLQNVVEFYDKGGGAGIGLREPGQTLPALHLNLTQHEKDCLVAFMESLTDDKAALQ